MENCNPAGNPGAPVPSAPCRRVGTFTFGVVLLVSGGLMLAAMFFPKLDFTWALKLSPLMLVSLGVETLLAARGGGRVKYDWVGMLLCGCIVTAAVALFAVAWCLLYAPEHICW